MALLLLLWLHQEATRTRWSCCWTEAPTWRPRSAYELEQCHAARRTVAGVTGGPSTAMASRRQGAVLMPHASVGGLAGGAVWKAVTVRRCTVWFKHAFAQYGTPALAWAARRGRKDTVELLLDRGADLEAKNGVRAAFVPH